MGFQHPHQQAHKKAGMAKALASPNTPAHLKPHLQNALGIGAHPMMDPDENEEGMETTASMGGQIGRSVDPNVSVYKNGPMQKKPAKVAKPAKVKAAPKAMKKPKKNMLYGA